jgi:hypothetical protein
MGMVLVVCQWHSSLRILLNKDMSAWVWIKGVLGKVKAEELTW